MSYDDDTKRILNLHDQNRELRAEIERLRAGRKREAMSDIVERFRPQFAPADVWAVARAFLETAIDHDVSSGNNAYNLCRHCRGKVWWEDDPETIEHEPTCPVLVARDLLTGAPK